MTENDPRPTRNMTRRRLAAMLGASPVLAALSWIGGCSGGGGVASRAGPVSDHFDGERFFNPGGAKPRGFLDLARWTLGGNDEGWPGTYPSPFPLDRPPPRVRGGALRVSFVGHATFLIQGAGLNILTDPVWSGRASPFSSIGPKRANPPGIAFDDLRRSTPSWCRTATTTTSTSRPSRASGAATGRGRHGRSRWSARLLPAAWRNLVVGGA